MTDPHTADEATAPTEPAIDQTVDTPAPAATGPHYLSIVAFTLGLVGIISPGLPSIAAIVLGHIGLSKEPSGRTFAMVGLVAGYVMVGLFVIGVILFMTFWGIAMSAIFAGLGDMAMGGLPRRFG